MVSRSEFIRGSLSTALAAGFGGCASPFRGEGMPSATRGVIVAARNLSRAFDWPRLAHEAGLTTIATHFGPKDVMPFMESDHGRRFMDACAGYGIAVEHELHALEHLLPRDLFAKNPELFRMDEKGNRVGDWNCCATNERGLEIIAENAVRIARVCRSTTGRHYFWLSDGKPVCKCPKCRGLSGADQAVLIENAIVGALRREIAPDATLSHLAYSETLQTPKQVRPDPALFLEFAPFRRWHSTTRRDDLVEGCEYLARLDDLMTVFPASQTQICEYWLDASLFCGWKKPLVRIPWNAERTRRDIAAYTKRGIRHFTTFAVSVDDEYIADFGPDSLQCVKEYGQLLKEGVNG